MRYHVATAAAFSMIGAVALGAVPAKQAATVPGATHCRDCEAVLQAAATAGYLRALALPHNCGSRYSFNEGVLSIYSAVGDIRGVGRSVYETAFTSIFRLGTVELKKACEGAAGMVPSAIKLKD